MGSLSRLLSLLSPTTYPYGAMMQKNELKLLLQQHVRFVWYLTVIQMKCYSLHGVCTAVGTKWRQV